MKSPRSFRKCPRFAYGAAVLALMASLEAQTGTWIAPSNGVWSAAANWQAGFVPDGAQQVADFTGVNLAAFTTVTLDGPRTVGSLLADDKQTASHSWIFSPVADDPTAILTLDNGASRPVFAIKNNLAAPYYARVRFPLVGAQGLVKNQGLGTLWLDADNSGLSGGVRVEQGALRVTQPQALGADPLTLQLVSSANVNTNWLRLELGPDLTNSASPANLVISNAINIGPFSGPSVGAIAAVDTAENRVTLLTGPITVTGNGGAGGLFTGPTTKGSRLEITGPVIANDINANTQTIDAGHVRLSGGGSVLGWRNNGFLSLGADNALSGAGGITFQNAYSRSATFDLNGYDLTLASLSRVNRSAVFNSNSLDVSVLALDATSSFTYSDSLSGNLSMVKKGAGTFTLSSTTSNLNNSITTQGTTTVTLLDGDTLGLAPGQVIFGSPVGTTTTIGSSTATVSSSLGLKVGMSVFGPNVSSGTKINAISGSTLTLSVPATSTGSVVTHNFSPLPAGAKIVSINDASSFTVSAPALVSSLETVSGVGIVTPFSFQVSSHHAYTGRTVLNGGIYSISTVSNPLEPGGLGAVPTVSPEYLVFEGGSLRYTGVSASTNRGFTIRDSINAIFNVTLSTTELTVGGDSPASTGGLQKQGSGRLSLVGDHLYTGPTDVAAGTLVIRDGGTLSTDSAVTVRSSATLAAGGTVGPVTLENGATLEVGPRSSATLAAPTLTAPSLTVAPTSNLEFEFSGGAAHDRLRVTAAGGLNIQGGKIGLFQNGGTSPVAVAGTYGIIDYTGSFTGDLSTLTLTSAASGFTYSLVDDVTNTEIDLVVSAILARSWSGSTGGSWTTSANWGGGSGNTPDTFGESAVFGSAISAPSTINLDSAATVSGLTFSSTRAYTISGFGSLTLDAGASAVEVKTETSAGSHLINVPVTLAGPLRASSIANSTITFGKDVTTASSAELSGSGTVAFGGNVGFSTISVLGGTFQIGAGGAGGAVSASEITLASGARVSIKRSDAFDFATNVKGSGGTLAHEGTGTTTLTGTGSTYGTLLLRSGTVRLGGPDVVPGALGVMSAALTMDAIGTAPNLVHSRLDLNGHDLQLGGVWSGTGGVVTDDSAAPGVTTLTYASGATSTYKGSINDGPQRQVALVKTQSSGLTLEGASSFSGGVTLRNGSLTLLGASPFGSGLFRVALQGVGGSSNFTRLLVGGGTTVSAPLALDNFFANGGAVVSLSPSGAASGTLSGAISVSSPTTNGHTFYGGSGARYLVLSGPISATGLTLVSGENVRFSNAAGNSTFAALEHRRGNLTLGADNGLAPGAQLFLAKDNSATFDLAGYDQTLAQLVRASTNYTSTVTNSVTAETSVLTLNPGTAFTYSGTFTGALSLEKAPGSADITLTGANTHTKPTVIHSGRLVVSGAGRLSASMVDLRGGSVLSLSGVTSVTSIALGGGLAGTGSVEAAGLSLSIGAKFEPAGLSVTATNLALNPAAVTTYDIPGTFTYDTLQVIGAMNNGGALIVNFGPGANRSTGRTYDLVESTGTVSPGFSSVRVNGVSLVESGTSGNWTGTGTDGLNSRTYGYSYSEATGVLTITAGDSTSLLEDWYAANIPNPADRTAGADPDGDGFSNLLEYATGGNPMVSAPLNVVSAIQGGRLTLTYTPRADPALTYTVEGSMDLASGPWPTVVPFSGTNPLVGSADGQVTVVDSELLSVTPRRFLRIKVDYGTP